MSYEEAKKKYAFRGIDTDEAIRRIEAFSRHFIETYKA